MEHFDLVTTGVKIYVEKKLNEEKTKLPSVQKKETYLKSRVFKNSFQLSSSIYQVPEINYYKDPPDTLHLFTIPNIDYETHSSYIIIPSSKRKTGKKRLRNFTDLTKREIIEETKDFSIEGVSSPTHVKVFKRPEFLNSVKPKLSVIKRLSNEILHNESSLKEVLF